VAVYGHEVTTRRCTFIVPEAARERAARLVYADTFGAVATG
jgi:hypothetical protein